MAVGALRGGHLLHVPVWLQHQFLGHGLVVGVPEAQTAIAAFSTRLHRTVCRDGEGTVLTRLDLEESGESKDIKG